MNVMEGQQGIPLEEALKRSQKEMAGRAGERRKKAKNEKAELDLQLRTLRSSISIEGMDFRDQNAMVDLLSKREYLAQLVILEKAVQSDMISPQQMVDLFGAARDNNTRLAVIENLPQLKFANPEEKKEALSLLRDLAIGNPNKGGIKPLELNHFDRMYLSKYRLNWEENEDFDIMTTAAIETLAKLGKDAEDHLVDVLRMNLEKGKPPDIKDIVGPEKYVSVGDDGSPDDFFDERGFPADDEVKSLFDNMYSYNSLVLRRLAEMGSKKGVDFLAESVPEKDSFNVIYYQEATELLASMLKEAKAAGEKIDYETEKYLKLYEKPIGEDLPDEEKVEILEMARDTYFNDVYKDNPEAAQRVIDDLEGELFGMDGLKSQRTYTLKYQGRVIAFCRFKPIERKPDELYAGSLNVYKDLQGLSVGRYFVRATLGKESKNHVIRAITRADNSVNEDYKKCGFVIDEKNPFEKNGVQYFNMAMDRREKKPLS